MAEPQRFILKHTLVDCSNIPYGKYIDGDTEKHLDVPWRVRTFKNENNTDFYLECLKSRNTGGWFIDCDVELKFIKTGGSKRIAKLNNRFPSDSFTIYNATNYLMRERYSENGNFSFEVHVTIRKMEGVRPILRKFDESVERFSDVKLVVQSQKFYVSKNHLAAHSPVFDSMFFGQFVEAGKSEIELNDVDPYDFQKFPEVINGEPAVNDDTVEEILELGDFFQSETVVRSCEEFLIRSSEKPIKMKFQAAIKHKMDRLKEKCYPEMKTAADIQSVLPEDIDDFDKQDYVDLIRKAAFLNHETA